jgi:tripartite-type tricarboxylate transporter receptor subunit TctC
MGMSYSKIRQICWGLAAVATISAATVLPASAQDGDFPSGPITIIAGFPAGGKVDSINRILAPELEAELGVSIVPVPKPGAGGSIASQEVAQAKPDGYTLITQVPGSLFTRPFIYEVPYSIDDFTPIATIAGSTLLLQVRKDALWETFDELVADVKANPGEYNYSTPGGGGQGQLAMAGIAELVGLDMVHVPGKGGPGTLANLVGGHVEMIIGDNTSPETRALATTAPQRSSFFPDVPALRELGYDIDFVARFMLVGPKGMPADRVEKIQAALAKALAKPEVQKKIAGLDMEVMFEPSSDLAKVWTSETEKLERIIRSLGLAVDQQKN